MLFENERQEGVKCTNTHCAFHMEEIDIICDSVDNGGGPSYANCFNYLPEKLHTKDENPNSAELAEEISHNYFHKWRGWGRADITYEIGEMLANSFPTGKQQTKMQLPELEELKKEAQDWLDSTPPMEENPTPMELTEYLYFFIARQQHLS